MLSLKVDATPNPAPAGTAIHFAIHAYNRGTSDIQSDRGIKGPQIAVSDASGRVLGLSGWEDRKPNTVDPLILAVDVFHAGKEATEDITWDPVYCGGDQSPLSPGNYSVRAVWMTAGGHGAWWSEPIRLQVS